MSFLLGVSLVPGPFKGMGMSQGVSLVPGLFKGMGMSGCWVCSGMRHQGVSTIPPSGYGILRDTVGNQAVRILLEGFLVCRISVSLTDVHILDLSERVTSRRELMNLGIKVLRQRDFKIKSAITNAREIQDAAYDVLSAWFLQQNNRGEAYTSLYTGLRENRMNQLAGELKQWVQKTPTQVTTTPDERKFTQDCIPVGCLPPARGPYLPACSALGVGVPSPGEVGFGPGGCLVLGVAWSWGCLLPVGCQPGLGGV